MTANITFDGSSYNVPCTEDGRIALADILAKFSSKIDLCQLFSHASLSDVNDRTNKLLQDKNKYFTCRASGQYVLHLNAPTIAKSIPSNNLLSTSATKLPAISPTCHDPISKRISPKPQPPISDTFTILTNPVDLEIAMILSSLAYSTEPLLEVNDQYPYSTNEGYSQAVAELTEPGCGLKHAKDAPHPYLMAVSKRHIAEAEQNDKSIQTTLWIAFPGTQDGWDILADLKAFQSIHESGCIHAGFLARATAMPQHFFNMEFRRQKYDRMIFTGHSLGGAVAHICAIAQLRHPSSQAGTQIYSIAFGTPFIGDEALQKMLCRYKLNDRFLTLVNENDPVPALLLLSMTAKEFENPINKFKDFFVRLFSFARKFVFNEWLSEIIAFIKPVLSVFLECIKHFFQYVPFGTYAFLQLHSSDNKMKLLSGKKEIIKRLKKILSNIKEHMYSNVLNHFKDNYRNSLYHSSICSRIQPVPSTPSRKIKDLKEYCLPQIDNISAIVQSEGASFEIEITGLIASCINGPKGNLSMSFVVSEPNKSNDWEISKPQKPNKWIASKKRLLPSHARITVGAHYIRFKTHFGHEKQPILSDNIHIKDETNHKIGMHFNANMLYASLLHACFVFLHDIENPDKEMTRNKHLMILRQLIQECNSEKDSDYFTEFFQQDANPIGELLYYGNFHKKMPSIIFELYKVLVQEVSYKCPNGYFYSGLCLAAGVVAVTTLGSNPLGWAAAGAFAAVGTYLAYDTREQRQYYGVEKWAYCNHLGLIANIIGIPTKKCTNEQMFEAEIRKKLAENQVPEKIDDSTQIPEKLFAVKYKNLGKKREAIRFARQTTLVYTLRLSIRSRCYVTFLDDGKKNQLLSTLWQIPSTESFRGQVTCYPLVTRKGEYELVLLLLPTRVNLHDTMNKLKQFYMIEPKLCVSVSFANDPSTMSSFATANCLQNYNSSVSSDVHAASSEHQQLLITNFSRMPYQRSQSICKSTTLSLPMKEVIIAVGASSTQRTIKPLDSLCSTDSLESGNKNTIALFLNAHLRRVFPDKKNINIENYEYRTQSARCVY